MRYPADLLAQIRETLTELYIERGDIRRLLDDTGIPAGRVNLEQDAVGVWRDAVGDAARLGLLRQLLTVALRDYPGGVSPASAPLTALLRSVEEAEAAARQEWPPRFPPFSEKNGTGEWSNSKPR